LRKLAATDAAVAAVDSQTPIYYLTKWLGNGRQAVPKPEIIGSPQSTYTRVVCMVCEEKGIDYVLTQALLRAPEVFAIHPFGKMPVLRHGDFALCESKAIATYLDRSFAGPPLIPAEPRLAALTEQWVSLVNTAMDATLVRTYLLAYAFPRTADGKPDRTAIDAVTPALREQFAILDQAVAATGYLVGDGFTLADINLLPILYYVRQLPEGAQALTAATHLARYYERHAARPSFARTIPPPGPPRRSEPN
jgi:glutathione S-transferase